jgi:uncharacterized hydrophobic protein (TIGR00341 family)
MSLRLIELIVPEQDLSDLRELLEEKGFGDTWVEAAPASPGRARMLVPADRTETVTDLIQQRYGHREGFRMLLLPIEATLPHVQEEKRRPEQGPATEERAPASKGPKRISREELYQDIAGGLRVSTTYLVMVILSTFVAAIGLVRGQVAVVIGAMVIAPLLRPNAGLALAATLGDVALTRKSLRAMLAGLALAGSLSILLGLALRVDPSVPELAERTIVGIPDILVAFAAGGAGALAFTTGLPAPLIGVMVAVALLPPLVTAGLLLGAGHVTLAARAAVLLATNVACVNLAGVLTFLAQGVRPRTFWAEEKAKRATRRAIALWIAMLAVLLFLIMVLWS